MIVAALALLLGAQPAQAPLSDPDPRPMRPLDPLGPPRVTYEEQAPSSPAARVEVAAFGACIADTSPVKSAELLDQDFRTTSYRNAMRALTDHNRGCFKARGRMRASNLMVAGSIAERLLWRSGADTTGKRLALAAGRPAVQTYAPSDAAAVCVVRSDPDGVARLFASSPASDGEGKAMVPLRALFIRCAGRPVQGADEGLRAMLATAAFRSVATGGKVG